MKNIRNFCIIAHIDHGKSTLADRMMEISGVIDPSEKWQVLDSMELEQERGITIKLAPVRMFWKDYQFNLIDTPWHVDFQYEVSRSLAAVEGVILLVDATQGIQAQTLSTLYMALDYDLEIIPVMNKIDLPAADPERVGAEIEKLIGVPKESIIQVSAKTWENVEQVLDTIIDNIPDPSFSMDKFGIEDDIPRALIFDSVYDPYKGVVIYVKSIQWEIQTGKKVHLIHSEKELLANQTWYFYPNYTKAKSLGSGEIWYIITGLKSVRDAKIWDTIINIETSRGTGKGWEKPTTDELKKYLIPGFQTMQPMVYSGVYPMQTDEYEKLRDSLEKLAINDSAITYDYESSKAFGFGFRTGFLGMLHMDIVKERLSREFNMETIFTIPNVIYILKLKGFSHDRVRTGENVVELEKTGLWQEVVKINNSKLKLNSDQMEERFELIEWKIVDREWKLETIALRSYLVVRSGWDMPDLWYIDKIYEPYVNVEIVGNTEFSGNIMELAQDYRGNLKTMDYLDDERILWKYEMPLWEIIVDFHDKLKWVSKGYASMGYDPIWYKVEDLVRLDVHINKEHVEAFSTVVHRDNAFYRWRDITKRLKELIPRHMFTVPIQAVIWSKPIARETISAMKKDVIAKCYGWDISRKKKLLKNQKEWKKRMKDIGKVSVPNDIFIKMIKR